MEINLKNKLIFINGLTGAIGETLARECVSLGARVYGLYGKNKSKAETLFKEMGIKGLSLDLGKEKITPESLKNFLGAERIYGLINAGGLTIDKPLMSLKEEEWDEVIGVNLTGLFSLTKALLPWIVEGGRIINLSSSVGLIGARGQANYASAKAGLWGFTKSLAREASVNKIMVNLVLPGFIPSGMSQRASPSAWEMAREESLTGDLLSPETVADFIVYLLSDYSQGITGQAFNIDNRIRRWW